MMRVNPTRAALVLAAILLAAPAAWAQQRPLVTEDPETVGAGRILLESGIKWEQDVFIPVSGLRGDVLTGPSIGVSVGVSSIAELQLDGGLFQKMQIKSRVPGPFSPYLDIPEDATSTSDVEDMVIGAKVRFLSETAGRPAMGFRFATRLPNASNESGLGRDVQDFAAALLVAKTIQSVRFVANTGILIMGEPTELARQDDLFIFSLSVARAITQRSEIVGEYVGRVNFAETVKADAQDSGMMRFGARFTQGAFRVDGGVIIGVTPRDPEFGYTVGFTYVFNAFRVP